MASNAVTKKLTLEGAVKELGHFWCDMTQVSNILGFSHLKEKHRINYDSYKEYVFLAHTKLVTNTFKATPEVLYAFKPLSRIRDVTLPHYHKSNYILL